MLPERRYAAWLPTAKPPPRPVLVTFGLSVACVAFLGMIASLLLPFEAVGRVVGFLIPPIVVGYSLMMLGLVLHWRKQKARVPIRELPALVDQFPAMLVLSREMPYGANEGLVSFVDGWLLFSGQGVSLSVRREDVRFSIDDGQTAFEFDGPYGVHRATFRPMGKGMQAAWIAWRRSDERPDGEPTYPPIVPPPGRRPNRALRALALFYLVLGLLTARTLPLVGAVEALLAPLVLLFDAAGRDALRRLAAGEPPRTTGVLAAFRRAKGRFPNPPATEVDPLPNLESPSIDAPEAQATHVVR